MIPFNYHHLYYFYVIAHQGSIAKATEVLHLAQPTLSTQLKQFERFLKVPLFIRENKQLILTEEGRQVLAYAKTIFDIGQELRNRMVDLSHKGRPQIQIGITTHVPKTIVDILLDYILKKEPDVYISLVKDNMKKLIQDLDSHLLDIVLTDTPFETAITENFNTKFIGKIPIAFCAHPTLAKNIKRFPQDLNHQPMILPASPNQLFYELKEFFYEHQINPHVVAEIQDIETVRRLVLRAYGIAPLNLLTIKGAPSKQGLSIINKPQQCPLNEKVYLVSKKRKMMPSLINTIYKSFNLEDYLSIQF